MSYYVKSGLILSTLYFRLLFRADSAAEEIKCPVAGNGGKMKKAKMIGMRLVVVCLLILTFFAGQGIRYWLIDGHAFAKDEKLYQANDEAVAEDAEGETEYISKTQLVDCKLCGGGEETLMSLYEGQDNLGIISLNTFQVAVITINKYDNNGKLIEEADSGLGTNIVNTGDDGFMSMVSANTNRGYASADISMNNDKNLDMEKVSTNLCTDCLNRVMEDDWREPYGIGIINFKTGEIRLFDESMRGFMLGDFYVLCEPRTEGDEEEISEINLNIFYCPERYE